MLHYSVLVSFFRSLIINCFFRSLLTSCMGLFISLSLTLLLIFRLCLSLLYCFLIPFIVRVFSEYFRRVVKFFRSYGEKKQRTYSSLLNPSFDFSTKSRSKPAFVLCGEKKKKKRVSESASAAFSSRLKTQNIKSVSPMWLLLH